MRKVLIIGLLIITPLFSTQLLAADGNSPDAQDRTKAKIEQKDGVLGRVTPPDAVSKIGTGEVGINTFLGTIVQLIFIVATVGFVFMVLLSAVQMILSGGDKESLGKARGRLTWAIIGIILLALSFVIFRILSDITGFNFTI